MYQALSLMLLGLLLLLGQFSNLSHGPLSPVLEHAALVHCQTDVGSDCHHAVPDDYCADTHTDCVIKCAQGSVWANTLPVHLVLALNRAMPPPVHQRLTDHPPEPPYQPPRHIQSV